MHLLRQQAFCYASLQIIRYFWCHTLSTDDKRLFKELKSNNVDFFYLSRLVQPGLSRQFYIQLEKSASDWLSIRKNITQLRSRLFMFVPIVSRDFNYRLRSLQISPFLTDSYICYMPIFIRLSSNKPFDIDVGMPEVNKHVSLIMLKYKELFKTMDGQ